MDINGMNLIFSSELPNPPHFWKLFQTTGWNEDYQLSPHEYFQALEASWYTLSVYADNLLVGFGRLVSDGIVHAMIYDLIVTPEYQQKGIGTQILQKLVERCQQAQIRDIQLFCARGKCTFYERRGFKARPLDAPGMQYRSERKPQISPVAQD